MGVKMEGKSPKIKSKSPIEKTYPAVTIGGEDYEFAKLTVGTIKPVWTLILKIMSQDLVPLISFGQAALAYNRLSDDDDAEAVAATFRATLDALLISLAHGGFIDDLHTLCAHLLDMSEEEFNELDFEAPILILEGLANHPDLPERLGNALKRMGQVDLSKTLKRFGLTVLPS